MVKTEDRYNYQLKYYGTYYFCNLIQNLVESDNVGYARHFDDFFSNFVYENRFQKDSVLHQFIYFCIERVFFENIDSVIKSKNDENGITDFRESDFFVCKVLEYHEVKRVRLEEWVSKVKFKNNHTEDIIYEYFNDYIPDEIFELINRLSEEVFHILFQNRTFLFKFNLFVADIFTASAEDNGQYKEFLIKKSGYFKRVGIPSWVKRAVFYRDRGVCIFCPTNLSGIIDSLPTENFDHMVPLAKGGINDVSNIQLACETCNKSKNDEASTTDVYRRMFINK
ncbi:HNH endonuclease [Bacillus cereus group sp. TH253LC]|uniref:HNH endonuclease n=1 Tax=Bacillus cereus group sp. TH253LC TaxID=3018043 RepID=UPI0022E7D277|nr:HNH endonuclease [Bacillus cereus group sp. TH253LC]MDA1545847.1 HNH endonuclease [Bacillus cereus group sp. TH253LC]